MDQTGSSIIDEAGPCLWTSPWCVGLTGGVYVAISYVLRGMKDGFKLATKWFPETLQIETKKTENDQNMASIDLTMLKGLKYVHNDQHIAKICTKSGLDMFIIGSKIGLK